MMSGSIGFWFEWEEIAKTRQRRERKNASMISNTKSVDLTHPKRLLCCGRYLINKYWLFSVKYGHVSSKGKKSEFEP